MPTWIVFVYGMCTGAGTTVLGLYLANWRILRSWSSDQRKPR